MVKSSRLWTAFVVIIILICIIAFSLIFYLELSASTFVVTPLGKIEGITANRLGKTIRCYYGIPYAQPPIGDLRFSKPKPAKPWKGVLNANKMPSVCMQSNPNTKDPRIIKFLSEVPEWKLAMNLSMNEDCLYLNVFAPEADITTLKSNLTVMVWIHGGGFRGGHLAYYDGATIAAFANVIVVSINYRLGIFGFLYAEEISGNFGLYDQVMALEWVKENIWAFGGDTSNVVIFGESAGGISCGYHLISHKSEHLFRRAILQSGNAVVPIAIAGPEQQRNATLKVIKLTECSVETDDVSNNSIITNFTMSCLRSLNSSYLYEIYNRITDDIRYAFLPVEDNDFFDEHPYDLVKNKKFGPQKEILIGSNSVEGAHFSRIGPVGKYWSHSKIPENFTKSFFIEILKNDGPETARPWVEFVADYVFDGVDDVNDPNQVWERYVKVIGDLLFICPDLLFINAFSSLHNRNVFYYSFVPRPSFAPWSPSWVKGAVHADELPFVFGFPIVVQEYYNHEEIELSKKMITVWTQFAKSGVPSGCNSWQSYTKEVPLYMQFDVGMSQQKQGFPGFKCDQYYDNLYNRTINYVRSGKTLRP